VPEDRCTYQLTSVFIPDGIEDGPLRRRLLDEYHIEIGGGLGQFGGNMWRIGLMGESSTASNVLTLLSALETLLPQSGFEVAGGAGVAAASQSLAAD
jgi:alanine-glyoxylate transaminase/serine-glyoxylate transaminase/serine-pyruvate transaminase